MTTMTKWADIKHEVPRDGLIADEHNRVWKRFGDAPIFLRADDPFDDEPKTVAWPIKDDHWARLLEEGDCGHDYGPFASCEGSRCNR